MSYLLKTKAGTARFCETTISAKGSNPIWPAARQNITSNTLPQSAGHPSFFTAPLECATNTIDGLVNSGSAMFFT